MQKKKKISIIFVIRRVEGTDFLLKKKDVKNEILFLNFPRYLEKVFELPQNKIMKKERSFELPP